jgi:hypothetical protein
VARKAVLICAEGRYEVAASDVHGVVNETRHVSDGIIVDIVYVMRQVQAPAVDGAMQGLDAGAQFVEFREGDGDACALLMLEVHPPADAYDQHERRGHGADDCECLEPTGH